MFLFVCCLRLQKLWRNSAFPFLCFNLPLSSPEFFYCSSGFLLCFFFVCYAWILGLNQSWV
jgi:hypothetical protein